MPYKILKQFIPTGQPGDPEWASRNVFVYRVTSGSYSGSDDTYNNLRQTYLAQDQLESNDQLNYQGWGTLGNGRYFLNTELGKETKLNKREIDKKKKEFKDKKLKMEIHSFQPLSGSVGNIIEISGSNLYGCYRVDFGRIPATGSNFKEGDNIINVIVPRGAESGKLTIFKYDDKNEKSKEDFIVISGSSLRPRARKVI